MLQPACESEDKTPIPVPTLDISLVLLGRIALCFFLRLNFRCDLMLKMTMLHLEAWKNAGAVPHRKLGLGNLLTLEYALVLEPVRQRKCVKAVSRAASCKQGLMVF